jgi:hypothetical protein
VYKERNPELTKTDRANLLEKLFDDMDTALEGSDTMRYIDYAMRLNARMGKRFDIGYDLTDTCIDTASYDPFMRQGITNPGKFFRNFADAGLPLRDVSSIKVVDNNGRTKFLHVTEIEQSDVILQFRNTDETIRYTELQNQEISIAPSKELSYPLCFSNLVPVVYGSQNSGGYYEPYTQSKQLVENMGVSPIMFRIQERYDGDYTKMQTVFDFYRS